MSYSSRERNYLIEKRINRLQGNISIIKIGGRNKTEQNEIRDKLIDGLNAVRNSVIGGVSPGGGSAFVHASKILDFFKLQNEEEQAGVEILKYALREPFKKIVSNSGENGEYKLHKLLKDSNINLGID
jgi:chaperonin GroEL